MTTQLGPVIIAKRGSCSFVTKVRNIQHVGARLAVVFNDNQTQDIN